MEFGWWPRWPHLHKATRQADGSYRVTIKATDHKDSTGNYRADAYIVDDSNNRHYLSEKVVDVRQSPNCFINDRSMFQLVVLMRLSL